MIKGESGRKTAFFEEMERLDAPLYNAVASATGARARFCMPSHAGAAKGALFASCAFDYTEVEGLDNLCCPTGAILQAEEAAAKAQGCARTLFVTQGSTVCMHIVLSIAKERGEVAYVGDMHKSFFGGCRLLSLQPKGYASVDDFLSDIGKNQNVSAVFYTSPDYFGNVTDDARLIRECRKAGIITVADAAHGAHFPYSGLLPQAAAGRADVSFCSTHKTMATYTGGAFLNLRDDRFYDEAVCFRQLWHTTSPSYLVMASADYSRALWQRDGERFYAEILEKRKEFEKSAAGAAYTVEKSDDISRLVLRFAGRDAAQASAYLAGKGVYVEAAVGDRLIVILNPFNADKLPVLKETLDGFVPEKALAEYGSGDRKRSDAAGRIAFVPVEEGEGRVCMNEVGFYPPGTPFVRKGEIFTKEDVDLIAKNAGCTFGLVNGKLVVLQ